MHALLTLSAFCVALLGSAVSLQALRVSDTRPRPFLTVAFGGIVSALLTAIYVGTFAGKALDLFPPECLIDAITIGVFVAGPLLLVGIVLAFMQRRRNSLYGRTWLFFIVLGVASIGILFLPRASRTQKAAPAQREAPHVSQPVKASRA